MIVALVIVEGFSTGVGHTAFTRKFDIDCSHCHTVAPALNDFGEHSVLTGIACVVWRSASRKNSAIR
jgi:hypothetical protein